MGQSLLIQAKLPKRYWVRALSIKERVRSSSSPENRQDATIYEFLAAQHMLWRERST